MAANFIMQVSGPVRFSLAKITPYPKARGDLPARGIPLA
jgi:hypothetical protein